jgi:iron(III) transport system permease protein
MNRPALAWSVAGLLGAMALPWYALQEGLGTGAWFWGLWSSEDYADGVAQIVVHGRWWLAPVFVALLWCLAVAMLPLKSGRRGTLLAAGAAAGIVLFGAQAFAIGLRGWTAAWLVSLFGEMEQRQVGIGGGATLVLVALLSLLSIGLALRGAFGGDGFVAGAMTAVTASIVLFTAWPILHILAQAFQDGDGGWQPLLAVQRLAEAKIWSLRCLWGAGAAACSGTRWYWRCAAASVPPGWGSPSR